MLELTKTACLCLAALALPALGLAAGCTVEPADGSPAQHGTAQPFVASAADFSGFRTWAHVPGESPNPPTSAHTVGPRTVYVRPFPSHGETAFPVGTIIVKEVEAGDIPSRRVFAMAKRGGSFDAAGAVGWEWFELKNLDDTHVEIVWRGVTPPLADGYLGLNGGCNGCHAASPSNDFVQTTGLQLGSL